jgi:ribonuclease Z
MSYSIRFFGTSSASPSLRRGFACLGLVKKIQSGNEDILLMDCGDGSIRKIMETKTSCLSISNILITHLHSDHLSGLIQIIETMSIEKRTRDLSVFGPKGLKEYFATAQKATNVASNRKFRIEIREVNHGEELSFSEIKVGTFLMQHTIPCLGYRIDNSSFSLAYTGDTEPCANSVPLAQSTDLLIHEATYLEKDRTKAREAKHSTPREASEIATKAGAKALVLTHVNDRYETDKEMQEECEPVYPKAKIAHDGFEIRL